MYVTVSLPQIITIGSYINSYQRSRATNEIGEFYNSFYEAICEEINIDLRKDLESEIQSPFTFLGAFQEVEAFQKNLYNPFGYPIEVADDSAVMYKKYSRALNTEIKKLNKYTNEILVGLFKDHYKIEDFEIRLEDLEKKGFKNDPPGYYDDD